jgi:hypothetical protein
MVKGGREGGAELVFKTVTIFPLVIIQAFTHPANIRNRYTNITGRNQAILSRLSVSFFIWTFPVSGSTSLLKNYLRLYSLSAVHND